MRIVQIALAGAICLVCAWTVLAVNKPTQAVSRLAPKHLRVRPYLRIERSWQRTKLWISKDGAFAMYGLGAGRGKYTRVGNTLHLIYPRSNPLASLALFSSVLPAKLKPLPPQKVLEVDVDGPGQAVYQPSNHNLKTKWIRVDPKSNEELIKDLAKSGSEASDDDRDIALDELLARGNAALPYLSEALLISPDPGLQMRAAMLMGECKSPVALDQLIKALDSYDSKKIDSHDSMVPYTIMRSLGKLKARQAEPALERYATTQLWVKSAAFTALGEIGDPKSVDFLVTQLDSKELQKHSGVIADIIKALGVIDDPRCLSAVLKWESSHDPEILAALSDAVPKLERNPSKRSQFVPALLAQLETYNAIALTEPHKRIGIGSDVLVVSTENDYKRLKVIKALGDSGDQRAISPLTELLGDSHTLNFEAAAGALLKLDPKGTKPKLKAWLKSKGYPVEKLKPALAR